MGMQSSRILFGGTDSKDIIFNGMYHKQMFLGNQLVWEKRIPDGDFKFLTSEIINAGFIILLMGSGEIFYGSELVAKFDYGEIDKDGFGPTASYPVKIFPNTLVTIKGNFAIKFQDAGLKEIYTPLPSSMNGVNLNLLFYACITLEKVPYNFFYNQTNLIDVNTAFFGTKIKEVPTGFFSRNPKLKFVGGAFMGCPSLTKVAPDLFANNPEVEDVSGMFASCEKITSAVPELWVTHPDAKHKGCFYGCTNAANYDEIPDDWKKKPY